MVHFVIKTQVEINTYRLNDTHQAFQVSVAYWPGGDRDR